MLVFTGAIGLTGVFTGKKVQYVQDHKEDRTQSHGDPAGN